MKNFKLNTYKIKIMVLTFFLMFSVIIINPIVTNALDQEIEVNNEADLITEISNASTSSGDRKTIIIDGSIVLNNPVYLLPGTDITLVAKSDGSSLLAGMQSHESMIIVPTSATLTIGRDSTDVPLIIDANGIVGGSLIHNLGDLVLNSGLITGATGLVMGIPGGGIYNSGTFVMNGGAISGNNAYGKSWGNGGGAVFTEGTFVMNGGIMENNTAWGNDAGVQKGGLGGAIFIKAGDATINGGIIRNNKAASGGGIYVYGSTTTPNDHAVLGVHNAIITANEAEESGGGVWLCQTGLTLSHSTLGTTVIGNYVKDNQSNSRVGGDDYFSEVKYNAGYVITLPERTLTGTKLDWFTDKPSERYNYNGVREQVENGSIVTDTELYLHTESRLNTITEVKDHATVIIEDNYAINGGGISANGVVTFGIPDEDVDFEVTKKWEDAKTQHEAVDVQLYQYVDLNNNGILDDNERINPVEIDGVVTLNDANQWTYKWTSLPKYFETATGRFGYLYSVEEITNLSGYKSTQSEAQFDDTTRTYKVTITNSEVIEVEGTKTWNHGSNPSEKQPTDLTIILSANGKILENVEPEWTKNGNTWTYSFKNLPKYENGVEIVYTVQEEEIAGYKGYQSGFDFTNTYEEPKAALINLSGTKTWNHGSNPTMNQPTDLEVVLSANGTILSGVKPVWTKNGNTWTYSFNGLLKYKDGKEIVYSVKEEEVPGYTGHQSGYDFTNTFNEPQSEYIEISGTKTWIDFDNEKNTRPNEITIMLFGNGKKISETTTSASADWKYSFKNIQKYDQNHKLIKYTVEEKHVEGYTAHYKGYDISNKLVTVPNLPNTGISSSQLLNCGIALIGLGTVFMIGFKKRNKSMKN
ncbi:Cna B-type domain-containing protein [Erysipelothrix tonsillarum]|uniref:Cna B-type domain-containing protein n=1 Tax=Erysipelothrix tonsillarum TaxID=38402 RepID=UPI00036C13E6|nr:Cna B-type domain-containing protein [Erysipelothrix tonsillarum]